MKRRIMEKGLFILRLVLKGPWQGEGFGLPAFPGMHLSV